MIICASPAATSSSGTPFGGPDFPEAIEAPLFASGTARLRSHGRDAVRNAVAIVWRVGVPAAARAVM